MAARTLCLVALALLALGGCGPALRASTPPPPSPASVPRVAAGTACCTQVGRCPLPGAAEVGSPCACSSPNGPLIGRVC